MTGSYKCFFVCKCNILSCFYCCNGRAYPDHEVKDKQIEELNARLADVSSALVAAQQTAQVAQALHAGTLQQRLTSGGEMREVVDDKPQKRGWFSRLFFGEDS